MWPDLNHGCATGDSGLYAAHLPSRGLSLDAWLLGIWSGRILLGSFGVWVSPPQVGVLWTPGYWGFANGVYLFHRGYWGPHVGFYGGINYGFGYGGGGFFGGRWNGGVFAYNTAVVNVDRNRRYAQCVRR